MTREEAKEKLYMEWQKFLENNIDYAGISEAYKMAFKALEQEPREGHWIPMGIVDENGNRNYECSECHHSDVQAASMTVPYCWFCGTRMIKLQESETWNGIHAQITAPKGTFERIFNEADDDNDI